jgi:cyclopropane fatty-acyl-phospholipid synthase-like methyltransferase
MTQFLFNDRFPRSNQYNPVWAMENPMGANPLWLTEWLTQHIDLQPDMRVLDLGCGKAKSSIFLAREYDVEVWAVDLWTGADENLVRVEDAGVSDRVVPIHADARQLPFAGEFFDAVVCIDSFQYFGTDDLYLNYLAHFVREGATLAFVSAGQMQEFGQSVPDHLKRLWTGDYWTLHTSEWWKRHVEKAGLFEVTHAGTMPDGCRLWLEWAEATHSAAWYREALKADQGRYLGYTSIVARRIEGPPLAEHAWPSTLRFRESDYQPYPLLRDTRPAHGPLKSLTDRLLGSRRDRHGN